MAGTVSFLELKLKLFILRVVSYECTKISRGDSRWHKSGSDEVTFPHSKVIDTRGQVCGHSDKCRPSPSLLCHLDDRNFCRNLVQGTWVSNKSAIMYHYFVSTICPEGVTNSMFITWGARVPVSTSDLVVCLAVGTCFWTQNIYHWHSFYVYFFILLF